MAGLIWLLQMMMKIAIAPSDNDENDSDEPLSAPPSFRSMQMVDEGLVVETEDFETTIQEFVLMLGTDKAGDEEASSNSDNAGTDADEED